jgi:hypothetical protein
MFHVQHRRRTANAGTGKRTAIQMEEVPMRAHSTRTFGDGAHASLVPAQRYAGRRGAARHRAPPTAPLPLRSATIRVPLPRSPAGVGGRPPSTAADVLAGRRATPPGGRSVWLRSPTSRAQSARVSCHQGLGRVPAAGLQTQLSQPKSPPASTAPRFAKVALSPILPQSKPLVGRTPPAGVPFQPRY